METAEEIVGSMDELEKRKEKIWGNVFNWIKNPLNFSLTSVLIFAFAIRFYYFIQIGNQPLWWDEAVYGSLAKNIVYGLWNQSDVILHESITRPPLLPLIWSLFIKLGTSEIIIRFFLEFIPSFLSVFVVYLIAKEIFNKRTGIISAFIFSVLWIHLFYTLRFLTNVPALFFLFLSVYLFIKATKSDLDYKLFFLSLFFLSLSTLIRHPNGLIFLIYLIILIFRKNLLLNKLKFWYSGLAGIFPLLFFFIWNYFKHGNIFPSLLGGTYINSEEFLVRSIAFNLLNYIPVYLKTIFFIFFLVGLSFFLFELMAGYNLIQKNSKIRNYLLLFLIFVIIYSFFIFYIRAAEDRWLFVISLPLCCLTGFGIDIFYKFLKKYNKYLAIILILIILFAGAFSQIKFADDLIQNKKESYLQIRQGFEWIKENTPKESVIIGNGIQPYAVYYAERQYLNFPANQSGENEIEKADYLVAHVFTPQSEYMSPYLQENQDKWQPLKGFFFDSGQTQPALIVYQRIDRLNYD